MVLCQLRPTSGGAGWSHCGGKTGVSKSSSATEGGEDLLLSPASFSLLLGAVFLCSFPGFGWGSFWPLYPIALGQTLPVGASSSPYDGNASSQGLQATHTLHMHVILLPALFPALT